MGRKRSLPARAREKAVVEEMMDSIEQEARKSSLQSKPDESLFIIDSQGSKRKRRKVQKENTGSKRLSKNEKMLMEKRYLGKGKPKMKMAGAKSSAVSDVWGDDSAVAPTAGDGDAVVASNGGGGAAGSLAQEAVVGEDEFVQPPRKPGQPSKRPKPTARDLAKLAVCHPGQSYNPAEEDHDDALASAVAVEFRREEALTDERKPVSSGMSQETLDVLVDKDFDESDDEDDEGDGVGELPALIGRKTAGTGKLTRAQRNKQARKRESEKELAVRKRKKDMLKSIDRVTEIQVELAEQEMARGERRRVKALMKARKAEQKAAGAVPGDLFGLGTGVVGMGSKEKARNKDIIAGKSVPVNLKDELKGSLRQLKTQGSLLLEKVELLKASKAHPDTRLGKERSKKARKGFRKKHKMIDRYKDDD